MVKIKIDTKTLPNSKAARDFVREMRKDIRVISRIKKIMRIYGK